MENAVKALLIAASVLIGIMILSLGVSLYSSLQQFVDDAQEERDINALQKFNEQFTRYINWDGKPNSIPEFTLTIQDIVTVANTAYENNKNHELTEPSTGLDGSYYIKVSMSGYANPDYANLERVINGDMADILAADTEGQNYVCRTEDIKINEVTGRVYEIIFHKYTPPGET